MFFVVQLTNKKKSLLSIYLKATLLRYQYMGMSDFKLDHTSKTPVVLIFCFDVFLNKLHMGSTGGSIHLFFGLETTEDTL